MREVIITDNSAETIICVNCNKTNSIVKEHCKSCGCFLWEEQPQNETKNEIQSTCSWEIQGASFIGRRQNNEDAYLIKSTESYHDNKSETIHLLAVADGMGGLKNGEEASRTAVTTISRSITKDTFFLKTSIKAANTKIYIEGLKKSMEMGTTIMAALITNEEIHVFWAGDSPLYHIRENEIIFRTEDHTDKPGSNLLTKSLGAEEFIELSETKLQAKPGDFILLCSDGLSGFMKDREICEIISASNSLQDACNSMMRNALENGSNDNITAILAGYGSR